MSDDIRVVIPPGGEYTYIFSVSGDFPFYLEDAMQIRCLIHVSNALDAPPIDPSVPTDIYDATEFLYTGDDPIQTGVIPGTIEAGRVAVLRGRVLDKVDNPLSGVTITVLDHPEYGQTLSREDGMFDLAVNGGGALTLEYHKDDYLPVQRPDGPSLARL